MGRRVLLIEDDPDNRRVYALLLRYRGYDVLEAADGETGLELAQRHAPDVVVVDLGLPGVDGHGVAAKLRAAAPTRTIPLIAVTAHAFAEDQDRARASGFDAFLAKPVDPTRVLAEVERWLSGRDGGAVSTGPPEPPPPA